MERSEIENCNFIRSILMLCVIAQHCCAFWSGTSWFVGSPIFSSKVLSIISSFLSSFHIYTFAFVSGYIFHYVKYEKGGYQKFFPFAVNKFKRLIVPYIAVTLVWIIPINQYFYDYSIAECIKKYILTGSASQLWFLTMLFSLFLIFYIISDFVEEHNAIGWLIVIGFWFIGTYAQIPNLFQIVSAIKYMPFFYMGFKVHQYDCRLLRKVNPLVWLTIFVVARTCLSYSNKMIADLPIIYDLAKTMVNILGTLMAFFGLNKFAVIFSDKVKAIDYLSKHSMTMYLFHQQFIYFGIVWLNGKVLPEINALVCFIVSVGISLGISIVFHKFKITKFLIGEKI